MKACETGSGAGSLLALVEAALEEQQQPTAVERFAAWHDRQSAGARESRYRALLPARAPRPGEQYAFEVDLDRCSGCKACVTGCHNRNGLDPGETWRVVGTFAGERDGIPAVQTVTAACHHCLEPACLQGCPVAAYEKDPVTGAVIHLDDQCIGCRYCIFQCPYEVPQYNPRCGVVRKCDLCVDRLRVGQAPACVESCPNDAIRIVVVDATDVRRRPDHGLAALPEAPDGRLTVPSTRYQTRSPLAPISDVDDAPRPPQPAHWPLVAFLLLTQIGTGWLALGTAGRLGILGRAAAPAAAALDAGAGALLAGLLAASLHLGRPLLGYRVVVGLRRSWLSREAVAAGAAVGAALVAGPFHPWVPQAYEAATAIVALLLAVATVFCSAMVYVDTPRPAWRTRATVARFFLTAVAAAAAPLFLAAPAAGAAVLATGLALGLLTERRPRSGDGPEARDIRRLLRGPLARWSRARTWAAGIAAAACASLLLCAASGAEPAPPAAALLALLAFGSWTLGAVCERLLFFRAALPPRLSGGRS